MFQEITNVVPSVKSFILTVNHEDVNEKYVLNTRQVSSAQASCHDYFSMDDFKF